MVREGKSSVIPLPAVSHTPTSSIKFIALVEGDSSTYQFPDSLPWISQLSGPTSPRSHPHLCKLVFTLYISGCANTSLIYQTYFFLIYLYIYIDLSSLCEMLLTSAVTSLGGPMRRLIPDPMASSLMP